MSDAPNDQINVLVTASFSDDQMEMLRSVSPKLHIIQEIEPDAKDWQAAEVVYTFGSWLPDSLDAVPNLRWIQLNSAGADDVLAHPALQSDRIRITTTSGIHAQQMAHFAIMMMMAFNYKLPTMLQDQAQTLWREDRYQVYRAPEMQDQTVGIVGYGSIGREIARLAATMGMRVLASKRNLRRPAEEAGDYRVEGTGDPEGDIPDRLYPNEALASMASECDFLVVLLPLNEHTRHAINAQVLNAMKPHAILINLARGGVIDEDEMINTLKKGKIGGAALDVFEEEPLPAENDLWTLDNVIISPHVAGNSPQYLEKAAVLFAENLKRYVEKRPLLNVLDRETQY